MEALRSYFAGSYQIRILLGSLVAAIVADGVITKFLVLNGFAVEGNPFLYFWVGEDVFLIIKLLGGLLAALFGWNDNPALIEVLLYVGYFLGILLFIRKINDSSSTQAST